MRLKHKVVIKLSPGSQSVRCIAPAANSGPQQGEIQGLPSEKKNKGNNSNPQINKLFWNINHPNSCLLNRAQYMSEEHIWDKARPDFWCYLKKEWTFSIVGEKGEKKLLKLIFVSWTVFEIPVSKVQNPRRKKWQVRGNSRLFSIWDRKGI